MGGTAPGPPSWLTPPAVVFGLGRLPMRRFETALFAVGLLAALAALLQSALDISTYGGIDLRPRVVGARCLCAGLDPYTFEWSPGHPDTLLDPNQGHPGLSRVTYPPPILLFYSTLAWLPYRVQRLLWFALEWSALLGSVALLARMVGRPRRLLFVVLALLFFAGGSFWRLHVERGQYYVFILFFLAAGTRLALGRPERHGTAGVLFGLAVTLRPTLILLPAVLFACRSRRLALTAVATAALVCLATLPFGGIALWRSCQSLTAAWAQLVTNPRLGEVPQQLQVPAEVEGVESRSALPDGSGNTTLAGAYFTYTQGQPGAVDIHAIANAGVLLWLASAPVLAWGWGRRLPRYACALGVTASVGLEFFLPIRIGYADVLFLLPMALLMRELFCEEQPAAPAVLLLFGLIAGHLLLFGSAVAAWLRALFVMAALAAGIWRARRPSFAKWPAAISPVDSP